jgi:hypothetical protein
MLTIPGARGVSQRDSQPVLSQRMTASPRWRFHQGGQGGVPGVRDPVVFQVVVLIPPAVKVADELPAPLLCDPAEALAVRGVLPTEERGLHLYEDLGAVRPQPLYGFHQQLLNFVCLAPLQLGSPLVSARPGVREGACCSDLVIKAAHDQQGIGMNSLAGQGKLNASQGP